MVGVRRGGGILPVGRRLHLMQRISHPRSTLRCCPLVPPWPGGLLADAVVVHLPLVGGAIPRLNILGVPLNGPTRSFLWPRTHTGCPTPDDATHCRTWGTIGRALHHDIDRNQAISLAQGYVTIQAGSWLNSCDPKKLRRVAGLYIMYPVPHSMDGPGAGLRFGDSPCEHP